MKHKNIFSKSVILGIIILGLLAFLLYPILTTKKISEIKTTENVGDGVRVHGEVKSVIKIGSLSGYILEDESGTIAVSSKNLPMDGEIVTVKGILIKDTILGYYIKTN